MTASARIGPAMRQALLIVHGADGALGCMLDLAEAVGPHGSRRYGYEIIKRCFRAGLLALDPVHPSRRGRRGCGAVVLTDVGHAEVENA